MLPDVYAIAPGAWGSTAKLLCGRLSAHSRARSTMDAAPADAVPMQSVGSRSARTRFCSVGGLDGFTPDQIAPSRHVARKPMINSALFGRHHTMRSPTPTSLTARECAAALTTVSSWRYVHDRSPSTRAAWSGCEAMPISRIWATDDKPKGHGGGGSRRARPVSGSNSISAIVAQCGSWGCRRGPSILRCD